MMAEYKLPSHPTSLVEDRFSLCEDYTDQLLIPHWVFIETLLKQPIAMMKDLTDLLGNNQYDLEISTLESVLQMPMFNCGSFYLNTFPKIVKLALRMPELFPTGTLKQMHPETPCVITLTREQIACLLVHMFLCTLKSPVWNKYWCNFGVWFASTSKPASEYVQCLLSYFSQLDSNGQPPNYHKEVYFKRCVLTGSPDWSISSSRFSDIVAPSFKLEPEPGCNIEVSFANKDVGFGVSGTQEEVKMGMSPEACVVMLLSPTLGDNETLLMQGVRQVGRSEGVGRDVTFTGICSSENRDWNLRCILAMDAMELDNEDSEGVIHELKREVLLRELNKAYCGFSSLGKERVSIATGHWGCGAFGGNKYLKSLIQVMAACQANKMLVFHDIVQGSSFPQEICDVVKVLSEQGVTVGELFLALTKLNLQERGVFEDVKKVFTKRD